MKRVIAAVVATVLLVGASSAFAATPLERRVAALEQRTKTLQRRNTTLQRRVTTLTRQVRDARTIGISALEYSICLSAITADAIQGTWSVVNQVAGRPIFAAPQTLNERGICSDLRVARQPTQVPPTISPFSALLALLGEAPVLPRTFLW